MSSSETLRQAVRDARSTRQILLIAGDTHDLLFARNGHTYRLRQFLALEAAGDGMDVVAYRRSTPPVQICPEGTAPRAELNKRLRELWRAATDGAEQLGGEMAPPERVLPGLLQLFENPDGPPLLLIVEGVENLLPDTNAPVSDPADLDQLDLLQRFFKGSRYDRGSGLLALAEHASQVHPRLRTSPGVMVVELPGPNLTERIRLLEMTHPGGMSHAWYSEIGQASSGLLLDDVQMLDQLARGTGAALDCAMVTKKKAEILHRRCPHLELVEPGEGLAEVTGLEHLKFFVAGHRLAGLRQRGLLLTGPPGTGKTYFTRALASSLGMPVVKLNLIDSSFIGDNERRMRAALRSIEQLAPVVVFFDEIDEHFQSRTKGPQGDSGTTERVQAEFMAWSGDLAAKPEVTLIGTTNRPDRVDVALRSRFPVSIPVLHPTPSDLRALIPSIALQLGVPLSDALDLDTIIGHHHLRAVSARQIGAMLEAAAVSAARLHHARTPIQTGDLLAAADALRGEPPVEDELWSLLALRDCSDRSLLSWWDGSCLRPGAEIPHFAKQVCDEIGRLVDERLDARISSLMDGAVQ